VVWATTLQFPSNGEAFADGVEQMVAEAAARAMTQIRLPMPIMGVLLFDFVREFRRITRSGIYHESRARSMSGSVSTICIIQ
jgi:hypothetical protein